MFAALFGHSSSTSSVSEGPGAAAFWSTPQKQSVDPVFEIKELFLRCVAITIIPTSTGRKLIRVLRGGKNKTTTGTQNQYTLVWLGGAW